MEKTIVAILRRMDRRLARIERAVLRDAKQSARKAEKPPKKKLPIVKHL